LSLTLATAINFPGGRAVLATGVNNSATSWVLEAGGGTALALGGATYRVLRVYEAPLSGLPEDVTAVEYIRCSAISADTLTVARGQQGSTAQSWSAGAIVESVLTAADIDELKTELGLKVTGPATATDNAVARYDATTGELIQNSGVLCDDSNNVTGVAALTTSGAVNVGGSLIMTNSGPTTCPGTYNVRGDGSTIMDIDYNNDSGGATFTIRANASTTVFTVGETGNTTIAGSLGVTGTSTFSGRSILAVPSATTIASGTVALSAAYMILDTEGAASTDDLVTVTGGGNGDWLFLATSNSARDVVVKHGTGTDNFRLNGAADFTLTNATSMIALQRGGSVWNERWRITL